MATNYIYYPRVMQQGGNNFTRAKPEYFYQQYGNYVEEKTCSYKFLKAFSYLPCLPYSWSQSTRGAIGFAVFLFFIAAIAVTLGLIPLFITLGNSNAKNEFSIDVSNGLKLQNQDLFDILSSTVESNRTLEQNITLTSQINNLMSELNTKFRSFNPNFEKAYNVRFTPNTLDQSIDVSYSLKTKPIKKSDILELNNTVGNLVKNAGNFNDLTLTNSTVSLNDKINEILISDPVLGELPSKSSIILSSSNSGLLQSGSLSGGKGPKIPKHHDKHDTSAEHKKIQDMIKIKKLEDIYYPVHPPSYHEPEYHEPPAYPPPQYTPEYNYNHEPYTPSYNPPPSYNEYHESPSYQPSYEKEKYTSKYPDDYKEKERPKHHHESSKDKHHSHKLHEEKPIKNKLKNEETKNANLQATSTTKSTVKLSGDKLNTEKKNEKLKDIKLTDVDGDDENDSFLSEESFEEATTKKLKATTKSTKSNKTKKAKKTTKSAKLKIVIEENNKSTISVAKDKLKNTQDEAKKQEAKVEKVETVKEDKESEKEVKLKTTSVDKIKEKVTSDVEIESKAVEEVVISTVKQMLEKNEPVIEPIKTETTTKKETN
ncbi:unnamed protein product [Brachionus calyciflorus]|uniref:Uncharacterized protein n=1 Tax=Brachionus calyciflorus TaxID=104777 RepID=A0A813UA31_9BILA|nr:unnamed protein product [Brachionus calyciflorus]